MGETTERVNKLAGSQHFVVDRQQVIDCGGSDSFIQNQILNHRWQQLHIAVYQVDLRPPNGDARLMAAVLACGPGAAVSHRAAYSLWDLDGVGRCPTEVTMGFGNLAHPLDVIVHRTRRPPQITEIRGIPVTGVERTLLDCARFLPIRTLGKGLDSALRRHLTSMEAMYAVLATDGGRGVTGTRRLRRVLAERLYDTATDSGAEYDILYEIRLAGLPEPQIDHELFPRGDRRIPDFYWPELGKLVEIDGIDAHSSADQLDDDLERQNAILDLGIHIRRFTARRVRRDPSGVVKEIKEFLDQT